MKLNFKIQSEELNLAKLIEEEMEKKPKRVYMFFGTLKETGLNLIEEYIIDSKAKLNIYIGIDKKNTTKLMLEKLLMYTKNIYVYNNNDLKEFTSNVYVFEHEEKSIIILGSSSVSENSLINDTSVFSIIEYDLNNEKENKEYKENIKELTKLKNLEFTKLEKEYIEKLLSDKVIFSNKQYEHKVKSIAEFLGKKENKEKKEVVNLEEPLLGKVPVFDLSDSNIDFEIDDEDIEIEDETPRKIENDKIKKEVKLKETVEEIIEDDIEEEEFEDTLDLNDMLLTKSKVKLKVKENENNQEEVEEKDRVSYKKIDLNNVSNYIFELPSKKQNSKSNDSIKIPNYIKDLIPNFFEFSDSAKTDEISGALYKVKDIQVEVVDVKNKTKEFDKSAKMLQKNNQTYMTITSDILNNIEYDEKDIARIIKLSSNIYHIEIISKDMQEYRLWSKIMNKKLKGVDRSYGIM